MSQRAEAAAAKREEKKRQRERRDQLKNLDDLPRNESGQVILPTVVMAGKHEITILSLGTVVSDREKYVRFHRHLVK